MVLTLQRTNSSASEVGSVSLNALQQTEHYHFRLNNTRRWPADSESFITLIYSGKRSHVILFFFYLCAEADTAIYSLVHWGGRCLFTVSAVSSVSLEGSLLLPRTFISCCWSFISIIFTFSLFSPPQGNRRVHLAFHQCFRVSPGVSAAVAIQSISKQWTWLHVIVVTQQSSFSVG